MPRQNETGPHCCGEYVAGFKAALAAVQARIDLELTAIRDNGTEPMERKDVMRLIRKLGAAIGDRFEDRPVNARGGANGRERTAA